MAIAAQQLPSPTDLLLERIPLKNRGGPRRDNGELEIDLLLSARHLGHQYEPWAYPLPTGFSFNPDFWVPGTRLRHEFNVEVTILDLVLSRTNRRIMEHSRIKGRASDITGAVTKHAQAQERWERKLEKIRMTKELYGIPTILISYAKRVEVMADPRKFDKLINEATSLMLAS